MVASSALYSRIVSISNIESAYVEIFQKFSTQDKVGKYKGVDNLNLDDLLHNASEVVAEIRKELLEFSPIRPTLQYSIPKKSGERRLVYACSIKDRIKSLAISRVLDPIFEKRYSPFLFSYRSQYPSYYAGKSVTRRYKRFFGQDFLLVTDIKDYAPSIDRSILLQKLCNIGLPQDVIALLKLFIEVPIFGESKAEARGVLPGIPLAAEFENIYLTDMDFEIGSKVALYRRVGDDLIIFDKNLAKVQKAFSIVKQYCANLGLTYNIKKTKLTNSCEPFEFLGYHFENRKISIAKSSMSKIKSSWRCKIQNYHFQDAKNKLPDYKLVQELEAIFYKRENSLVADYLTILRQYPLIDDSGQARQLSFFVWKLVVTYIFGSYSPRNHRLAEKILRENKVKVPSFLTYFLDRQGFLNG